MSGRAPTAPEIDARTVVDKPRSAVADSTRTAQHTAATKLLTSAAPSGGSRHEPTISTPAEMLRDEEVRRTRGFAVFVLILASSALVAIAVIGGDPRAKAVHAVGAGIGVLGALLTLWKLRRPLAYRPRDGVVFGYCCVLAISSGYYYWGDVSGVALMVPIGIYFFALGQSFIGALSLLVLVQVLTGTLSISIMTGLAEDRGLIRLHSGDWLEHLAAFLLIQGICAAAFLLARRLRKSNLRALERLDHAVRAIAQREALLAEARAEMEEVAQIGGPGRYTEHVVGSYRLGVVIGRGAMGEVYEASHVDTGAIAAAKLLNPRSLAEQSHLERFLRELEIAASLDVPNVVKVLEIPTERVPVPYLIMERLRGASLADILRDEPVQKPRAIAAIVREVGRGIRAAHRAGIVHRDLKPHNLFRHEPPSERPIWKVLDFGVSKLMDQSGTLTQGAIVGTPGYMAPEQARGETANERSDLYGLGAICYRAITGRPLFSGMEVPVLLHAVVYDMPARPSSIARLSSVFDDVLAVALAKAPEQRFGDPDELADALDAAAEDRISDELRARAHRLYRDYPWRDEPRPR